MGAGRCDRYIPFQRFLGNRNDDNNNDKLNSHCLPTLQQMQYKVITQHFVTGLLAKVSCTSCSLPTVVWTL